MTTPKITAPKNAAEAAAMDLAIATYNLSRASVVKEFLESAETKAFEAKLQEILDEGLMPGTAAGHLIQLPRFFSDVRSQTANDFMNLDMKVNPPKAPAAPEGSVAD